MVLTPTFGEFRLVCGQGKIYAFDPLARSWLPAACWLAAGWAGQRTDRSSR